MMNATSSRAISSGESGRTVMFHIAIPERKGPKNHAVKAAQTAVFGQPTQNLGNAYVPRQGQLACRISF